MVPTSGSSVVLQRSPSPVSPPAQRSSPGEKPPVPAGCDELTGGTSTKAACSRSFIEMPTACAVLPRSHNHKIPNSPQKGDDDRVRRKSFCSLGTGDRTIPLFSDNPGNTQQT